MIVAIGVDVDRTFTGFLRHALDTGLQLTCVNLRAMVQADWCFDLPPDRPATFDLGALHLSLPPDASYYCRIIDLTPADAPPELRARWRALTGAVRAWLDAAPGLVVNRPSAGLHNGAKPLHEALIRGLGLHVPESITASDPDALRRFAREGGCVSKTICGMRADTIRIGEGDLAGFTPEQGPIHLQRHVAGDDVRVHVVGTEILALRAAAGAVDYRRAGAIDGMMPIELPPALAGRLIDATAAFGLAFAGWDFKLADDGTFWCLEANPMPGYGPYDDQCDGAISAALVRLLQTPHR